MSSEGTERPAIGSAQTTIAGTARVANRDYIENVNVQRALDALTVLSQDELDTLAAVSERVFKWRFGFVVGPTLRAQILELKQLAELTDEAIRLLNATARIKFDESGVWLKPLRPLMWWGWIVVSYFLLLAGMLFWSFSTTTIASWQRVVAQLAFVLLLLIIAKLFHQLYVKPTRIALAAIKHMKDACHHTADK